MCGLMVMMEKLVAVASVGILSSYQRELLALFIQAFNLRAEEVQYVIIWLGVMLRFHFTHSFQNICKFLIFLFHEQSFIFC